MNFQEVEESLCEIAKDLILEVLIKYEKKGFILSQDDQSNLCPKITSADLE